ncbi:MAG TPA: rhodanese-like domain-containing protein [Anaerolineales bacterium]|nr:rhodanese-like domain-containing protein [Anaerolineales bacterium]
MVPEITAPELAEKLKGPKPPLLIDVREPVEYAYCRIEGAHLKPLGGIMRWANELDPEAEIILHCHIGERSLAAAHYLQHLGFKRVVNLVGGIEAWALLVDPTVPRY